MSTYGDKYTDLNQNKLTLKTQIQRYLVTKKDFEISARDEDSILQSV